MTWDDTSVIEAWMPSTSVWTTWVKPLVFSELERGHRGRELPYRERFDLAWVPPTHRERVEKREGSYRDGATVRTLREPVEARAALVIDLAAVRSIDLGMALVAHGHRPVPLFAGGAGAPPHHSIHDVARRIAAGARARLGPAAARGATGLPPRCLAPRGRRARGLLRACAALSTGLPRRTVPPRARRRPRDPREHAARACRGPASRAGALAARRRAHRVVPARQRDPAPAGARDPERSRVPHASSAQRLDRRARRERGLRRCSSRRPEEASAAVIRPRDALARRTAS